MEKKGPSFEEFVAGGFLANAPILFFTYIVKSAWPQVEAAPSLEILLTATLATGGIAAGYLVARRAERDHLRTGLKTGFSAFIVNFAFSSLLVEGTSITYGLWILLLFCSTSLTGSYLRKWVVGKRSPTSSMGKTGEQHAQAMYSLIQLLERRRIKGLTSVGASSAPGLTGALGLGKVRP